MRKDKKVLLKAFIKMKSKHLKLNFKMSTLSKGLFDKEKVLEKLYE